MPSDLPPRLQSARRRLQLLPEQIEERVGIPVETYLRYESGERAPDYTTLKRIAVALDTDVDSLLGDTSIVLRELERLREELDAVRSAVESMRGGRSIMKGAL